jgi:hypothetical protein
VLFLLLCFDPLARHLFIGQIRQCELEKNPYSNVECETSMFHISFLQSHKCKAFTCAIPIPQRCAFLFLCVHTCIHTCITFMCSHMHVHTCITSISPILPTISHLKTDFNRSSHLDHAAAFSGLLL